MMRWNIFRAKVESEKQVSLVNQTESTPPRFRLARHDNTKLRSIVFEIDCPLSEIMSADRRLVLNGWVAGEHNKVLGVRVSIAGDSKRRVFTELNELSDSPEAKQHHPELINVANAGFRIDIGILPEMQHGEDFAVEIEARTDSEWHPLTSITLVRDHYENPAVFVVGSPRSGTSVVGNSLRKTLSAEAGYGESHLLPIASVIRTTVEDYYSDNAASAIPGMMLHHVNPYLLTEKMLNVVKQRYSTEFHRSWIIDKTPGTPMINSLPDLQRLWPDARVIFMKRRGIENIMSRLVKYPQLEFEFHCKQWKNTMNAWKQVRDRLPRTLELDQYDVLTQPRQSAFEIAEFLGLSEEQHSKLSLHFGQDRPESTESSRSSEVLGLNSVNWSDEQKSVFMEHCSNVLDYWGYSLDENYYRSAA